MFRRLFWLITGMMVGFVGALWLQFKARAVGSRVTPMGVADTVVTATRRTKAELKAAAAEGRAGMAEAEARMRAEVTGPRR